MPPKTPVTPPTPGTEPWPGYPFDEPPPAPAGPVCEVDGEIPRDDGSDYYWHCGEAGTVDVDGTLMCAPHAGERGHGPMQEEFGFDPDDSPGPVPAAGDGMRECRFHGTVPDDHAED